MFLYATVVLYLNYSSVCNYFILREHSVKFLPNGKVKMQWFKTQNIAHNLNEETFLANQFV